MRKIIALVIVALIALQSAAVTIHRSFRTREVGFGGGVSASVPVDAKVAAALDEAEEKDAAKTKVIIGTAYLSSLIRGKTVRVEWRKAKRRM